MKERPILFSGEMVRAILEGRKTQTRRVVKGAYDDIWLRGDGLFCGKDANGNYVHKNFNCPYGQPGDRLWVREAFGLHDTEPKDGPDNARLYYKATDADRHDLRYQKWRPSIHMPRWASRITLEITGVRVERLQDITRSDIRAEGLQCPTELCSDEVTPNYRDWYGKEFRRLWESINGAESWAANPWVWVIEFKRL